MMHILPVTFVGSLEAARFFDQEANRDARPSK
jgi:hypothetical protein